MKRWRHAAAQLMSVCVPYSCTLAANERQWARSIQRRLEEQRGGWEEVSWSWGQPEVKAFGCCSKLPSAHNGQEGERPRGVAVVRSEEINWWGWTCQRDKSTNPASGSVTRLLVRVSVVVCLGLQGDAANNYTGNYSIKPRPPPASALLLLFSGHPAACGGDQGSTGSREQTGQGAVWPGDHAGRAAAQLGAVRIVNKVLRTRPAGVRLSSVYKTTL